MTVPGLAMPGGGRVQRLTAGVVAAIAVVSVAALASPAVAELVGTPAGAVRGAAWQVWRPFTGGLLANGLINLLMVAIFTYWCGADLERTLSTRRYLGVLACSALGAAVAASLLGWPALIGTAAALAWGLIGYSTFVAYRRGANVQTQLLILLVLLLAGMSSGMGVLISVGGLLGGVAAAAVAELLPTGRTRRPRADDWSRRRPTAGASSADGAVLGLAAVLLVVWILLQLVR